MNPFSEDTDEDNNEMRRLTHVLSDEDATATASDAIKRAQGIFETICEQRFTSFPGSFDEDSDNDPNGINVDGEEEDLWADKTKEISFATKSPDTGTVENDKNSSDEEEQVVAEPAKPEVAINSQKSSNSKMEIDGDDDDDDAWAELNHRNSSPE